MFSSHQKHKCIVEFIPVEMLRRHRGASINRVNNSYWDTRGKYTNLPFEQRHFCVTRLTRFKNTGGWFVLFLQCDFMVSLWNKSHVCLLQSNKYLGLVDGGTDLMDCGCKEPSNGPSITTIEGFFSSSVRYVSEHCSLREKEREKKGPFRINWALSSRERNLSLGTVVTEHSSRSLCGGSETTERPDVPRVVDGFGNVK